MELDLTADAVTLTRQLVDIESVSQDEQAIADAVEAALTALPHLTVTRRGARSAISRLVRLPTTTRSVVPVSSTCSSRDDSWPASRVETETISSQPISSTGFGCGRLTQRPAGVVTWG